MYRRSFLLAVALVLGVTGCGNDAGNSSSSPEPSISTPPSTPPSTPTPSPPVTPSVTSSKPPTPSTPPPPKRAKDGRNLSACADRTCQVEARSGDAIRFARKWEIMEFRVTRIAGNKLYFSSFDNEPSPLRGWVGGNGSVSTADIHVDITPLGANRTILTFRPR